MRGLGLACLVALAGCSGLGAKDVGLTIVAPANGVSDADLASVRAFEVTVSGAQSDHRRFDLGRAATRGESVLLHLRTATGNLGVGVLARDAQDQIVAVGTTTVDLDGPTPHEMNVVLGAPPGGPHTASVFAVTPAAHLQLFSGQTVTLGATTPVAWTVATGGAGGSVDGSGVYTAPATEGTDELTATSTQFYGQTQTISVDVLAHGVLYYAGLGRGAGTLDGIGADAQVAGPHALVSDGKGHVYFTDDGEVVRRLDLASNTVTTIAGTIESPIAVDGIGTAAGFGGVRALAYDAARDMLYVSDNSLVRRIALANGAVSLLAGSGQWGNVDGTGNLAQFEQVWGLAYDGNGTLYAADPFANVIRAIDVASGKVTTIAGVFNMTGAADGPAATATFNWPAALVLDGQSLYIGDSHNWEVRKLDLGSKIVSTVAGHVGQQGGSDGTLSAATLSYPEHLASDGNGGLWSGEGALRHIDIAAGMVTTPMVDGKPINQGFWSVGFGDGKIYVADNASIAQIDPSTYARTVLAGVLIPDSAWTPLSGSRFETRFHDGPGITRGPDGTIYVRDAFSVRKLDPATGTFSVLQQQPWIGGWGNIAVGADGSVYLAGDSTACIYKIDPSGMMRAYAGSCNNGGAVDGPLTTARFGAVRDLAFEGGVLYATDGNGTIRAIDVASGMVSTLAGTANMGGLVDDVGPAARFNGPQGIVGDGKGTLYVTSNNAVRKIVIATAAVTTIAGGDTCGFADATGSAARFCWPIRITMDLAHQNLYVSDQKNDSIRKVTLAGAVTTVAGTPGKAYLSLGPLPGAINEPVGLTFTATGDLLVMVPQEQSILQIRLP